VPFDIEAKEPCMKPASRSKLVAAAAVCVALAACSDAGGAPGGDPSGHWITASGNLEVEIAPCGRALCGTVVRVLANHSMSGSGEMKPTDARDPMGMQILTDLVPNTRATEWRGHVYDRENAKTYGAVVKLGAADELVVRGYVGLPLFGRSQTWTRAGGCG
jgi:uncharacterized protein (DUF2147 family)